MQQNYFIVVLAHSIHGRLRRVHVPYQVLYAVLGFALIGCVSVVGFVSSYARMALKVANYNELRSEAAVLRDRYQNLQKVVAETDEQLATLKLFANEVSAAYAIKESLAGPSDITAEGRLVPTFHETLGEYNSLKNTSFARFDRNTLRRFHRNVQPDIWPVAGRLMGGFGRREDPFSGMGAFHRGVDISAPTGTPVKAAADGIVVHAAYFGGYGRLVIIDHGNGTETYYAHLSKFDVVAGSEVRRGEIIGRVGSSGRSTAPHLHYEVRVGKVPVNPYRYLRNGTATVASRSDFPL
ncbi:MAG: M23 family metallopeptidase [Bryobacterales bacterium]|nr:M23 family metallopeptidase [Bryobacterales bacterium]